MRLNESPVFQRMKEEGETSKAPFRDSFAKWDNLKIVLVALFGCVAGQAVTFYTSTFYALYFLERILKVDGLTTNVLMAAALIIGAPLYVFFGWLSDRIGRKRIIMAGLALAALSYFPLFKALTAAANPALAAAQATAPVVVYAEAEACSFQFDPVGRAKFDRRACDVAKSTLARASVAYRNAPLPPGERTRIEIGDETIVAPDLEAMAEDARRPAIAAFQEATARALSAVGYPAAADPERINRPLVVLLVVLLLTITTMCYGPMAALLVEMFPARIRYTSLSTPYHVGNGWFGGLMPTTAFAIIAATGDIYAGLWYPVVVAAATLIIGVAFLPETLRRGAGPAQPK
jgi:MFS family permease